MRRVLDNGFTGNPFVAERAGVDGGWVNSRYNRPDRTMQFVYGNSIHELHGTVRSVIPAIDPSPIDSRSFSHEGIARESVVQNPAHRSGPYAHLDRPEFVARRRSTRSCAGTDHIQ